MHVPHFSDPGGPIRKADLLAALADLRDGQPFIYAFLRQIPIEEFCILVDDNARERTERVTVDRFCARYARYDPTDAFFVVRYHTYVYDKPERKKREYPFTGEEIGVCLRRSDLSDLKDRFTDILRYQLRKAILANRPFRLTDAPGPRPPGEPAARRETARGVQPSGCNRLPARADRPRMTPDGTGWNRTEPNESG